MRIAGNPQRALRAHSGFRRLCYLLLVASVSSSCDDTTPYGAGTPCNASEHCRSPLTCVQGYCELLAAEMAGSNAVSSTSAVGGSAGNSTYSAGGTGNPSNAVVTGGTLAAMGHDGGASAIGTGDGGLMSTSGGAGGTSYAGGVATGGATPSIGGATGGATANTGGAATGGATPDIGGATGGATANTGGTATGGATSNIGGVTGGATANTGGAPTGGATSNIGGATGGATANTGGAATGGATPNIGGATGGATANTGGAATGGATPNTGGGTGGATANTGGAATGGATSNIGGTAGMASTTSPGFPLGHACKVPSECDGGRCVDGVCCNRTCDGQCEACNLQNSPGICATKQGGQPVGTRTPCSSSGRICDLSCSGSVNCTYPDQSTVCDPTAYCSSTTIRHDGIGCDGAGACSVPLTSACATGNVCNRNTDGKCGVPVYTQVSVSGAHSCAVVSDGTLRCWGAPDSGELGLGIITDQRKPVVVADQFDVREVATGYAHTCVLRRDGEVACWGSDLNADLGCPNPNPSAPDTLTSCTVFPAGSTVGDIGSGGGELTCATVQGGGVKCWGRNDVGQLGIAASIPPPFYPVDVEDVTNVIAISTGLWHACAVRADNAALCWGDNSRGALGIGVPDSPSLPAFVYGIDGAIAVAASVTHTCFIVGGHAVRCAGDDSKGQLGDGLTGSQSFSLAPVVAQPGLSVVAVTTGAYFTCVMVNPTSVRCWGQGSVYGTLGNGSYLDSLSPVEVALPGSVSLKAIVSKVYHTCALTTTGRLWCWGNNSNGQLGNDSPDLSSSVPVEVVPP